MIDLGNLEAIVDKEGLVLMEEETRMAALRRDVDALESKLKIVRDQARLMRNQPSDTSNKLADAVARFNPFPASC